MHGIKRFFRHSVTIAWARLLVLLGILATVLPGIDVSTLVPAKYMPLWLIGIGVLTEVARRRSLASPGTEP
jgi:hypothetical protein